MIHPLFSARVTKKPQKKQTHRRDPRSGTLMALLGCPAHGTRCASICKLLSGNPARNSRHVVHELFGLLKSHHGTRTENPQSGSHSIYQPPSHHSRAASALKAPPGRACRQTEMLFAFEDALRDAPAGKCATIVPEARQQTQTWRCGGSRVSPARSGGSKVTEVSEVTCCSKQVINLVITGYKPGRVQRYQKSWFGQVSVARDLKHQPCSHTAAHALKQTSKPFPSLSAPTG